MTAEEHPESRSFRTGLYRASHVIKICNYPCAKIRAEMDLQLSVFLVRIIRKIFLKFHVDNLFNFDTRVLTDMYLLITDSTNWLHVAGAFLQQLTGIFSHPRLSTSEKEKSVRFIIELVFIIFTCKFMWHINCEY